MTADITVLAPAETREENPPRIRFIKGADEVRSPPSSANDHESMMAKIRDSLAEAISAKNVAFLLGCGCSSLLGDTGEQLGIPTMKPLAEEFTETVGLRGSKIFINASERRTLKASLGVDVNDEPYQSNLEALMEVLHSWQFSLRSSKEERHKSLLRVVNSCISKLKQFLFERCSKGSFSNGDNNVQDLYEMFYRKLIFRDRSLPRPWVFTTNYDLFNETAMDRMGLPYSNGFTGSVERRFNPSSFRYALAEQLDLTSRKWTAVDGFVYLCKLHGSISWIEDGQGLFPVREVQASHAGEENLMIYPTPAKHAASFSSPYSDLFREFQSRVVTEQSVLFVIGYSFGDAHVNNIIFQALTVPTFRLIILADPESQGQIAKLRALRDPRIWVIGGQDPETDDKAHYFSCFVKKMMPELPGVQVDTAVKNVLNDLLGRTSPRRLSADDGR